MSNTITKQIGGLVLKVNELNAILSEPDTVGLAFGLTKPGVSPNIDLLVYKVIEQDGELQGKVREIMYKMGTTKYSGAPKNLEYFKFEHLEELERCKFGFAYIDKHNYERLFENEEEEVFITGTTRDYGSMNEIKGEWFSLQVVPRNEYNEKLEASLFGAEPKNFYMPPCPPVWTKGLKSEGYTSINFKKSVS